jgi:hypothetical protein
VNSDALRDNPQLSNAEMQAIAAWVDGGAKEGNPADLPAPPRFAEGWQIGVPDLVLNAEPYRVRASGTVGSVTLSTDYVFAEDTWVQAIEVRPGNREAVHQALVTLDNGGAANSLHLYSPGLDATIYRDGYARFIPKGGTLQLQVHYVSIGTEIVDRSLVA